MVPPFVPNDLAVLGDAEQYSSACAASALGALSGQGLAVARVNASLIPIERLPYLHGDPEAIIVGVFFTVEGDLEGAMLAYFQLEDAMLLVEALTGERPAEIDDFNELGRSALAEAGNIVVSTFLSAHETLCGLQMMPSPPSLVIEMCSAVLTSAALMTLGCDEVGLLQAELIPQQTETRTAICDLIFFPTTESWRRLRGALAQE